MPGAMQAVVWDGQRVAVAERPAPEPTDGTAIVRVTLAGICNTDLEIVRGQGNGTYSEVRPEFKQPMSQGSDFWLTE